MARVPFTVVDGNGAKQTLYAEQDDTGNKVLYSQPSINDQAVGDDNPMPVKTPASAAAAADNHTVEVGGTAVVAFAGGSILNGAYIKNPAAASESIFVDFVEPPGLSEPGPDGTTIECLPGQMVTIPGGLTTDVRVNAASDGHVFGAVRF